MITSTKFFDNRGYKTGEWDPENTHANEYVIRAKQATVSRSTATTMGGSKGARVVRTQGFSSPLLRQLFEPAMFKSVIYDPVIDTYLRQDTTPDMDPTDLNMEGFLRETYAIALDDNSYYAGIASSTSIARDRKLSIIVGRLQNVLRNVISREFVRLVEEKRGLVSEEKSARLPPRANANSKRFVVKRWWAIRRNQAGDLPDIPQPPAERAAIGPRPMGNLFY